MESYQSQFLKESFGRGFVYQGTNLAELDAALQTKIVTGYIGFDATATSLHVGNLVQIMRLRWLQKTGHKPIVLMGDGTTRVGDPSGKDEQRQMLSDEKIEQNIQGIQKIFSRYLDFNDGPTGALLVRNSAWLSRLNYLDFLQTYGRHFSVNRMLSFESVKARLDRDQPLSFLEFNYMILQGYDFLHLSSGYGCTLQLGGSDQWGNILSGVDLIRRVNNIQAYGVTGSLITTADGKKMGKTTRGAVWLNADQLSTFDYWQFWRNTHDADVGKFLRLFTDFSLSEIADMEKIQGKELNEIKILLADAATLLCHGQEAVDAAHAQAQNLFQGQSVSQDARAQMPVKLTLDLNQLTQGLYLIDLIVTLDLATSKGQARRLVRENSVKVNDILINDELRQVQKSDFQTSNTTMKLSIGKKRHVFAGLNLN